LFFAVTEAPGMTPPDESTTSPESEEVAVPCAYAGAPVVATIASATSTGRSLITLRLIDFPS
jgi:hypothetical protein